ncbi:MAG: adenylate cyclase [Acidimicrobiia bacterium]
MTSTEVAPSLSASDLERVLGLMKGADSVELKLTVPNAAQRSTVAGLAIDPLDAQIRQVFFFDTPQLALNRAGLVVRARRVQGRDGDSAVKLRPVEPSELPSRLRKSPNLVVEVDAMPGGFVCSASLKSALTNAHVRDAVLGTRAVRKLFSKEQREFFAAHAPEGIALDDLPVLGPIFVLKLNFTPKEYGRKMVGEMWLYPDGSRILELSTKCQPGEAFQIAAETKAFLAKRGVDIGGEQHTKTKTALEFFSAELQAASSGGN